MNQYLSESNERINYGFDILHWWKGNCSKFKVLAQIAKDVLAIPISTVAFESKFSTGGRILDPFRSSLSPKTVEMLICGQNRLQSSPIPINLRETMEEIENLKQGILNLRSISIFCEIFLIII